MTRNLRSPRSGVDHGRAPRGQLGADTEHVGPWALLALLERFTPRARAAWTATALVALALSLAGPLSSGTTTAGKLALAGMHVATAAVLLAALPGRKLSR